jgi:phage tail-like protein
VDVNGTRYCLVIGRPGWFGGGPSPDALAWHQLDHTVRLAEVPFVFPERTGNRRLSPADRRGAARDRYGNWYWISPDRRQVRFQAAGTRGSTLFWPRTGECRPDGSFTDLAPVRPVVHHFAALAVTDHHYLVIGAPDLPGVLVFDLHGGGAPTSVRWPVALSPIDMAAAPDGGVWILDGPPGPGRSRYWALDRFLRIGNLAGAPAPATEPADFRPAHPGQGDPAVPPARHPGTPSEISAEWAVAIEALPDGSVLVLDHGAAGSARIVRQRDDTELGRLPLAPLVRPLDLVFASGPGGAASGTVFVAESQGDQAFAYDLDADASALTASTRYLPMRLFSGKALVAAGDQVYYDLGEHWLALADRRGMRYRNAATLDLEPLTAGEPGTVWHRVTLDARIPPGTSVRVFSRAADEPAALPGTPWRAEPAPYLRGLASEVPYHRFGAPDATDAGTWELLLQHAVGRHLQLRLVIAADGRHTPRLWALRAHHPRFSYLQHYLPDLYQEDPDAADFLDRYLANVEGLFTAHEGRIQDAQRLFDITTLDAEYVGWLGGWLGAVVDAGWDEARARLLVQHAVELFGRRGTVRGLVEAIRLATDPCPDSGIFADSPRAGFAVRIVEEFRMRPAPGRVFAGGTDASLRLIESGQRWQVADGGAELDRRYRQFVVGQHGSVAALASAWGRPVTTAAGGTSFAEPFPSLTPAGPVEAADRAAFIAGSLAIAYPDVTAADLAAYRGFLTQRYRRAEQLTAAWGLTGGSVLRSFDEVRLPGPAVPADGPALRDWIQFVAAYLPTVRSAHRLTVLVPVPLDGTDAARADLIARVAQVVARERPGHVAYQVKLYWAAFRLGEARVGLETSVGPGSRFTAMVLGEGRMARGYLGGGHPWDVADRRVVGRDRVRRATSTTSKSGGPVATDE